MSIQMIDMAAWMTENASLLPEVFLSRAREQGYETYVVLRLPATLQYDEKYVIARAKEHGIDKRTVDELVRYYR